MGMGMNKKSNGMEWNGRELLVAACLLFYLAVIVSNVSSFTRMRCSAKY
jgi:hypothetical protein